MTSRFYRRILVCALSLTLFFSLGQAQSVNIFVHQFPWMSSYLPDHNIINTAYSNYFTTVNITTGSVNATMGSLNSYDVVIICELLFGGTDNRMNASQQAVVQDFIANGGHVVWVGENNSSGAAPGTNHCMTTVANLWGINLNRIPTNGSPTVPYHGGGGPGGLTAGVTSVSTTNSYDYWSGPASLTNNVVLALSGGLGTCNQGSIRGMGYIFPEPNICDLNQGTMLLYGEVQMWSTYANTIGHQAHYRNVANLHHILLTGNQAQMTLLNNTWIPNSSCPAPPPCTVILSADILNFDVQHAGPGTGKLTWQTASEVLNVGFDIEHRYESGDFEKVGFVEGYGTTDQLQHYDFIQHNLAPGTHYFRLRQLDENGVESFSDVRTLEIRPEESTSIFPTVWNDQTEVVTLYSPEPDVVSLELIAMTGQVVQRVYEGEIDGDAFTEIPLRIEDLASGRYWLQVKGRNTQFGERILLTR